MSNDSVLQYAAALLAYIYDDVMICPLPEERDLLINSGNGSAEDLFDACRSVFGTNMNLAFRKTCIHIANYCDSLLEHADELFQKSHADTIIANTDMNIAAIEYLADHAPIDSIEDKANLNSLAYHARLCYKHLYKRYRSYIRSFKN